MTDVISSTNSSSFNTITKIITTKNYKNIIHLTKLSAMQFNEFSNRVHLENKNTMYAIPQQKILPCPMVCYGFLVEDHNPHSLTGNSLSSQKLRLLLYDKMTD